MRKVGTIMCYSMKKVLMEENPMCDEICQYGFLSNIAALTGTEDLITYFVAPRQSYV
jgi:hypothetical protein